MLDEVGVDLVAAEEVGDVDVPDILEGHDAPEQLADRRQHLEMHAGADHQVGNLTDHLGTGVGDGQDHRLHAAFGGSSSIRVRGPKTGTPRSRRFRLPRASSMKPTTWYGDSGSVLISRIELVTRVSSAVDQHAFGVLAGAPHWPCRAR